VVVLGPGTVDAILGGLVVELRRWTIFDEFHADSARTLPPALHGEDTADSAALERSTADDGASEASHHELLGKPHHRHTIPHRIRCAGRRWRERERTFLRGMRESSSW
jgi:hypothetical protein